MSMKNGLSYLYIILSFFLFSCEKEENGVLTTNDINVIISNKGDYNIHVVDENGIVSGVSVNIYAYLSENRYLIDQGETNATGDFSGVLDDGTYLCGVAAKKGKMFYFDELFFQVIPSKSITVEVNPFLKVGDLKLKIINSNDSAVPNINVALLPFPSYYPESYGYSFEEMIDKSYNVGVTDNEGWVRFNDIPVKNSTGSYDYSVLIYTDDNNYDVPNTFFSPTFESIKEKIIKTSL